MKKLLVALIAVASAVAVHAASVTWGCDIVEYNDETAINSGTYWILNLGTSSSIEGISVDETGAITYGQGVSVVATDSIQDAMSVMGDITGLSAANNGQYLALGVWDGLDSAHDGKYGISNAVAISGISDDPPLNGDMISFSNGQDSFGSAMFADTDVVPEPTSGLLMLLGLAGLALKRKKA